MARRAGVALVALGALGLWALSRRAGGGRQGDGGGPPDGGPPSEEVLQEQLALLRARLWREAGKEPPKASPWATPPPGQGGWQGIVRPIPPDGGTYYLGVQTLAQANPPGGFGFFVDRVYVQVFLPWVRAGSDQDLIDRFGAFIHEPSSNPLVVRVRPGDLLQFLVGLPVPTDFVGDYTDITHLALSPDDWGTVVPVAGGGQNGQEVVWQGQLPSTEAYRYVRYPGLMCEVRVPQDAVGQVYQVRIGFGVPTARCPQVPPPDSLMGEDPTFVLTQWDRSVVGRMGVLLPWLVEVVR